MELVEKETTNDGPIKVRDVRRWPANALQFLSAIDSASSFDELIKVQEIPIYTVYTLLILSKAPTLGQL